MIIVVITESSESWEDGVGTLALKADERVALVEFSNEFLVGGLMDGRRIPYMWLGLLLLWLLRINKFFGNFLQRRSHLMLAEEM